MNIRYTLGDLFKSNEPILLHGCNARGRMGSGVARLVRDLHPAAYKAYRDEFERNGLKLGQVIWAKSGSQMIGNAITQESYGNDGALYVSYEAVRSCFRAVNTYVEAQGNGIVTVGLPMIGAALGGGDWRVLSSIIAEEAHSFRPVVYILDQATLSQAIDLDPAFAGSGRETSARASD